MSKSGTSLRELLDGCRLLAMNWEYQAALASMEDILRKYPGDVAALRLKGNVLEQKALDEHGAKSRGLAISEDFLAALACYEQVLQADPRNTVALIDLGDHYKYLDSFDRAFIFYWKAMELLEAGEQRVGADSEIRELLSTCDDLLRYPSVRERRSSWLIVAMKCSERWAVDMPESSRSTGPDTRRRDGRL